MGACGNTSRGLASKSIEHGMHIHRRFNSFGNVQVIIIEHTTSMHGEGACCDAQIVAEIHGGWPNSWYRCHAIQAFRWRASTPNHAHISQRPAHACRHVDLICTIDTDVMTSSDHQLLVALLGFMFKRYGESPNCTPWRPCINAVKPDVHDHCLTLKDVAYQACA